MAGPTKTHFDEAPGLAPTRASSPATPAASAAFTLREGTRDDAALLGRLHARSWQATYRGIMSDAFLDGPVLAERDAHWHEKMQAWDPAHGAIWIVERDGEPVAFVNVLDNHEPQHGVYIDHLHVMTGNKGAGAGKRLIAATEQWARDRGAHRLHLLVWEANLPARGFYEHMGWTCIEKFEDQLVETRAMVCRYGRDL